VDGVWKDNNFAFHIPSNNTHWRGNHHIIWAKLWWSMWLVPEVEGRIKVCRFYFRISGLGFTLDRRHFGGWLHTCMCCWISYSGEICVKSLVAFDCEEKPHAISAVWACNVILNSPLANLLCGFWRAQIQFIVSSVGFYLTLFFKLASSIEFCSCFTCNVLTSLNIKGRHHHLL
jgi:hypothetical protein